MEIIERRCPTEMKRLYELAKIEEPKASHSSLLAMAKNRYIEPKLTNNMSELKAYKLVANIGEGLLLVEMEIGGFSFLKDGHFVVDRRGARRSWGSYNKAMVAWEKGKL